MDFGIIKSLAQAIVRPTRATYLTSDLGPSSFQLHNRRYERIDFTVLNSRSLLLHCTLFKDMFMLQSRETIIFLHANSSCRLVVKNYIQMFLPYYDLLVFDFAGSGMSEGQYITLGYCEKEDVYSVISAAREKYAVKDVILWGRSMGAVTALLYTAKYRNINAIVCDNAFSDFETLVNQLSGEYVPFLPGFLVGAVLNRVSSYIDEEICPVEKTDFKVKKLKPIACVDRIECPILFIASKHDQMVNIEHTLRLYKAANCLKKLITVPGNHNAIRTNDLKQKVLRFLSQRGRVSLLQRSTSTKKKRRAIFSDSPSLSQQEIRTYASLDKVAIKGPDQAEECHFTSPLDQKLFKQYGATHQLNDMPNEVPMNHKLPPKPCRASRLPIFPNKHYARVFKN